MANTITGFTTFVTKTVISSSDMNSNLSSLKDQSSMWQKYTVAYTALTAIGATATGNVTAFTLAADEILTGVYVKHSTAFSGGSVTAIKVKVGKSGEVNRYVTEFDVNQAVTTTAFSLNSVFEVENSLTAILVTASVTGSTLDSLSAGSVDVYFQKSTLPS